MALDDQSRQWRYAPTLGAVTNAAPGKAFTLEIRAAKARLARATDPVEKFREERNLARWQELDAAHKAAQRALEATRKEERRRRQNGQIQSEIFWPLVIFIFGCVLLGVVARKPSQHNAQLDTRAHTGQRP